MKKFANRVLALIVALTILLIPASAMAAEKNMITLSLGNFDVSAMGEEISLPVTLQLSLGADLEGERGMAALKLLAAKQTAATAYGVLEGGEVKAYIDGMDYGMYASLADLLALLEAEMGMTLEEMMTAAMAELQPAIESAMSSSMQLSGQLAGVNSAALQEAIGLTITDVGAENVNLFGQTFSASKLQIALPAQTVSAMLTNAQNADPAFAEFWTNYMGTLKAQLEAQGESISDAELNEVLSMITVAIDGTTWDAAEGDLCQLNLAVTIEGETVVFPFTVTTYEANGRTIFAFDFDLDIDGETGYMSIYADADTNAFEMTFLFGVRDTATGEIDTEVALAINGGQSGENVNFAMDLGVTDPYDPASMSLLYSGTAKHSDASDVYAGRLQFAVEFEGEKIEMAMDTGVELSSMPAGTLLSLPAGSINILEADDATWEQFTADMTTPLMQMLGVLMQEPAIAELIASAM